MKTQHSHPEEDLFLKFKNHTLRASQVVLVVKNPPANVGVIRDAGLILGLGQSPGRGHGNPPQYSRWENLMDKGAWWATVHKVAKSWTWLKNTCFDIEGIKIIRSECNIKT